MTLKQLSDQQLAIVRALWSLGEGSVAEVLGAQKGIGLIISEAQGTFDPNTVFACMVIIAVVTLGAEFFISLLEHRLLKWRPPSRSEAPAI